jgi:hypothetical protein
MKGAFDRLNGSLIRNNQHLVILYVGDHDPSGLDMVRDINTRLTEFGLFDFEVIHVALTMEQIEEFNPPPNPAKITDPRAGAYISEHGDESWELDALKPSDLERIVRGYAEEHIDQALFDDMVSTEEAHKEKLKEMVKDIK